MQDGDGLLCQGEHVGLGAGGLRKGHEGLLGAGVVLNPTGAFLHLPLEVRHEPGAPQGDGALGGQGVQELPFLRGEHMGFPEVEDDDAQRPVVEEHGQHGGGDGGHPARAGLQLGIGPHQVALLLEEQRLVPCQGVASRNILIEGAVLPQGLGALLVSLGGGDLQARFGLADQQDGPSHGVQGSQCGGEDHPKHVLPGVGGGQGSR